MPLCQIVYSNVKAYEDAEVDQYSPLSLRLDACNWPVLCPPALSSIQYSADPTEKNSTPAGKGTLLVTKLTELSRLLRRLRRVLLI